MTLPPLHLVSPFELAPVVRCFDRPEYVDNMLRGEIFISTLEACRNAENLRARDHEDGKQRHVIGHIEAEKMTPEFQAAAGRMGFGLPADAQRVAIGHSMAVSVLPDALVLCCSMRRSPELVRRFGRYAVRIHYPLAFAAEVTRVMLQQGVDVGGVQVGGVTYGPPETRDYEAPVGLIGFTKRADIFGVEEECRVLWHPRILKPPLSRLTLQVPNAIQYLEPLDPVEVDVSG